MAQVIKGRPDFHNHGYGITKAKRFPKYVYSNQGGLLLHEVAGVSMRWFDVADNGYNLIRLDSPHLTIETKCGTFFYSGKREYGKSKGKLRSIMCELPKPEAVLCGRCRGEGAVFPKIHNPMAQNNHVNVTKAEAKARLGCVVQAEQSDAL